MDKVVKFILGLSIVVIFVYLYSTTFSENINAESTSKSDPHRYDVIIVGAGISGLAAGDALRHQGYDVLVLEARDRVGGRIWTDRSLGIPLDMGASWIQGSEKNPITDLAKQYRIKTVARDLDTIALYESDGQPVSDELKEQLNAYVTKFQSYINRRQETHDDDMPLAEAVTNFIKLEGLDDSESIALRHAITLLVEGDYGAGIEELSLLEFNQDHELSGDDLFFPEGYDQVPLHLAKDLPILYHQVVNAISYDDNGVTVRTQQSEFNANYAICTVPLGVLKKDLIQFSPSLPETKQKAIQRLGMGLIDKLYLQFPRLFWEKDKESGFIGYLSGQALWTGFVNFYPYIQKPVLLAFNPGSAAKKMEEWSDEKIVADAMTVLKTIYGKDIPQPSGYLITRWAKDPFTFGSYSYLPVGASGNDYDEIAKSVSKRLFFAGEATNRRFPALVHGAYLSGLRAATELIKQKNNYEQTLFYLNKTFNNI